METMQRADIQGAGTKYDGGKLRLDLVPVEAIEALGAVLTHGASKYGDRNWERGMAWSRPYAALLRHLLAWWRGEDIDPESGLPHLWHAATNAAFLVAYAGRGIGTDDRPRQDASANNFCKACKKDLTKRFVCV